MTTGTDPTDEGGTPEPTFDAADLAEFILGLDRSDTAAPGASGAPSPAPPAPMCATAAATARPGNGLGWALLAALVLAVSIAISLAIQLEPGERDRVIPPCGGLYSTCCDELAGTREGDAPDRSRGKGLFDREVEFTDRSDDRC